MTAVSDVSLSSVTNCATSAGIICRTAIGSVMMRMICPPERPCDCAASVKPFGTARIPARTISAISAAVNADSAIAPAVNGASFTPMMRGSAKIGEEDHQQHRQRAHPFDVDRRGDAERPEARQAREREQHAGDERDGDRDRRERERDAQAARQEQQRAAD